MTEIQGNMEVVSLGMNNVMPSRVFLPHVVKKGKSRALKIRLRVLINGKGMSESDFYKSLGFSKQVWYALSWGIWECTTEQRVRISRALGVDSSVIFQLDKTEVKND